MHTMAVGRPVRNAVRPSSLNPDVLTKTPRDQTSLSVVRCFATV